MRAMTPCEEAALDAYLDAEAQRANDAADYWDGVAEDHLLRTEGPE